MSDFPFRILLMDSLSLKILSIVLSKSSPKVTVVDDDGDGVVCFIVVLMMAPDAVVQYSGRPVI